MPASPWGGGRGLRLLVGRSRSTQGHSGLWSPLFPWGGGGGSPHQGSHLGTHMAPGPHTELCLWQIPKDFGPQFPDVTGGMLIHPQNAEGQRDSHTTKSPSAAASAVCSRNQQPFHLILSQVLNLLQRHRQLLFRAGRPTGANGAERASAGRGATPFPTPWRTPPGRLGPFLKPCGGGEGLPPLVLIWVL